MTADLISVLVCTKDRPAQVERAARSLFASRGVDIELIVVDQSAGSLTRLALDGLPHVGRLRYVHSEAPCKSAAMNEGMHLARSDVVVCTDDDCEAPPEWVATMSSALRGRPDVAAVFSNVVASPYDPSAGYTPVYRRTDDHLLRSLLDVRQGWGMGAAMALRRSAVLALGGLDEVIGPGARVPSGDDVDIEFRLLSRGWQVFHTTSVAVVHHGFRNGDETRLLIRRNLVGLGAISGKLVRARCPSAAVLALCLVGEFALWPPLNDALHLRRPRGAHRVLSFARGFAIGLRTPVDRRTLRFRTGGVDADDKSR